MAYAYAPRAELACCCLRDLKGRSRRKKVRIQETAYAGRFRRLLRRRKRKTERKLASKIASKNGQVSRTTRTFSERAVAELDPKDPRSVRKNQARKERSSGGIGRSRRHYLVGGREPPDHAPGIAKEDRAKRYEGRSGRQLLIGGNRVRPHRFQVPQRHPHCRRYQQRRAVACACCDPRVPPDLVTRDGLTSHRERA